MKSKYPTLFIGPASTSRDTSFLLRGADTLETMGGTRAYLQSYVDHLGYDVPGVRVMKSSPESMTLQIRTNGPVTDSRRGTNRRVFSQFTSNRQNMLELAAEIIRIANMLPEV